MESHTPASFPQLLRILFDGFLSRLRLRLVRVVVEVPQKPSLSHFLNCESTVIDTSVKNIFLAYSECVHESWTSTRFLVTARAVNLSMVSGSSVDHRYQHGPRYNMGHGQHHSPSDSVGQGHRHDLWGSVGHDHQPGPPQQTSP